MRSLLAIVAAAPLLAGGCEFYFGGDDDCLYGGGAGEAADYYDPGLLNPETGQCEYGYGGPYPCDGVCGPCDYEAGDKALEAPPSWGSCASACTGLDETTCLGTAGCRAGYVDDCPPGSDCEAGADRTFYACWAVDTTGPIQGGGCAGLDAYECSRHDDCSALHLSATCGTDPATGAPIACPDIGLFEACLDETTAPAGCYAEYDCPEGSFCNFDLCQSDPTCAAAGDDSDEAVPCPTYCQGTCVEGDPGTCDGVALCDRIPPACPPDTIPAVRDGCYTGACLPLAECTGDPGSCDGVVTCDVAPPPCAAGTTPGIKDGCYTGACIPLDECRPDRGTCDGPVFCDSIPPDCPDGSTPGIADGCWTGYCIPLSECDPAVACTAIPDEASCVARDDCLPLYAGVDCTCRADGSCTCTTWRFVACTYPDV